jgi:hypothetical protein
MDALKATNASIYIDAARPLDIDLPIESAGSIDLEGRITRSITLDTIPPQKPRRTLTSTQRPPPKPHV